MVYNKKYGMEESELRKYRKCIICKRLVLRSEAVIKDEHPYCLYCHTHNKQLVEVIKQECS